MKTSNPERNSDGLSASGAAKHRRRHKRFVPGWPVLSPADMLRRNDGIVLPFPLCSPGQTSFYVARSAIYHLFRTLRLNADEWVLAPDYHSGNETAAIRAAGASIRFYPIDRYLRPDLDQVARLSRGKVRVLYVIHFAGWPQPMNELVALAREKNLILVEDCALSFLSLLDGRPLGSFGDYSIYCLYKTLPVPNGGVLVQNNPDLPRVVPPALRRCSRLSETGRLGEMVLGWLQSRCNGLGGGLSRLKRAVGKALTRCGMERVPVGNTGFDPAIVDLGMSPLGRSLLNAFDYPSIYRLRRANYGLMFEGLARKATPLCGELKPGVCPLFFPILVSDKREAARSLRKRGIEATELWNQGDPQVPVAGSEDARFLRNHVLELPIHQGVSWRQIEFMTEQVLDLGLHLRDGLPCDKRRTQARGNALGLDGSAPGASASG